MGEYLLVLLALSFRELSWTTKQQTNTSLSLHFTANALIELFIIVLLVIFHFVL